MAPIGYGLWAFYFITHSEADASEAAYYLVRTYTPCRPWHGWPRGFLWAFNEPSIALLMNVFRQTGHR